jgi:NAD(P)H-dependent FMN reductase
MKILIMNGSPKKKGTVATLLRAVAEGVAEKGHQVEWVDIYDLQMQPCQACMQCRPDKECQLMDDDAQKLGRKIKDADGLVIGTPTHWGNMSAQLKIMFDRNSTLFIKLQPRGLPIPLHKGKSAAIVTACLAPWPFNVISPESRGAIRAVKHVLKMAGFKMIGTFTKPGTDAHPTITQKELAQAKKLGSKF